MCIFVFAKIHFLSTCLLLITLTLSRSFMQPMPYHIPALLTETIDGLITDLSGTYVDGTFGGGGHSREILRRLTAQGRLLSFDQDEEALANAIDDPRFTMVYSNFRYLSNFMRYYGVSEVTGILADIGLSFRHIDAQRGFSFRRDDMLDMRMNRKARHTAAWIIANYTEEMLSQILSLYGELKNARRIASAIVKARAKKTIETVEQLLAVIRPLLNPKHETKDLACVFQAFRIEVNGELDALKSFLEQSLKVLKPGGRIAIISYHSLEDSITKRFFRSGNLSGVVEKDFYGRNLSPFKVITSKPIVPSAEEIDRNPRSRSAKLRIAEKL